MWHFDFAARPVLKDKSGPAVVEMVKAFAEQHGTLKPSFLELKVVPDDEETIFTALNLVPLLARWLCAIAADLTGSVQRVVNCDIEGAKTMGVLQGSLASNYNSNQLIDVDLIAPFCSHVFVSTIFYTLLQFQGVPGAIPAAATWCSPPAALASARAMSRRRPRGGCWRSRQRT